MQKFCGRIINLPVIKHSMPSVLWHCWLGGKKGIRPVKNWVVGCWHGCLSGDRYRCRFACGQADDIHFILLYFYSSIQLYGCKCVNKLSSYCHSLSLAPVNPDWFYPPGFTFLVPAHLGSPGQSQGGHKAVVVVAVVVIKHSQLCGHYRLCKHRCNAITSIHLSVHPLPLYLSNRLTSVLDLLHVYGSWHSSPGLEGQHQRSRSILTLNLTPSQP